MGGGGGEGGFSKNVQGCSSNIFGYEIKHNSMFLGPKLRILYFLNFRSIICLKFILPLLGYEISDIDLKTFTEGESLLYIIKEC